MVRSGEVRVNGGRAKVHYRLQLGDDVRLPPVRQQLAPPPSVIPAGLAARLTDAILYESDDLLVLNKPSGLAVHGGSGLSFGVIEALRCLRGPRLELIHRLDRETSGVLLIAKTRAALIRWQAAFRPEVGGTSKQYLVLVAGVWAHRHLSVRRSLTKFTAASGERRVRLDQAGKFARTDFQLLAKNADYSLLQASLHTGRTHQIRVHCHAEGHPVLGDDKYGNAAIDALSKRLGVRRLCLHAARLRVRTPAMQESFSAPVPGDIQVLIAALE
jgi:23S rRNA pseudouridine955/2504/2580 synthase